MHDEVYAYVRDVVEAEGLQGRSVVEIGSRDVNGSCRPLFTGSYFGIDIGEGPGVDLVADGSTWVADRLYGVGLCTEVFEHTESWRQIVGALANAVEPSGFLIVTCATEGRDPHSAVDGGQLRDGEYYGNVSADEMRTELERWCSTVSVEVGNASAHNGDLRAFGIRR